MRRHSLKRARAERTYAHLRADYLFDHPMCERCGLERSTDLHHKVNRSQSSRALLDVETFAALCRFCHDHLTTHPELAVSEGWSVPGWVYRGEAS